MEKKNQIDSYVILRVLLTLLVVIGHCAYYTIATKYGGIDWNGAMTSAGVNDTTSHKMASLLSTLIYTFHMPMFFGLSGALYEYGGKKSFSAMLISKGKRLLIPFIVVTSFVSIPLKYIAGYWSNSENIIQDILIGQYCIQGNTHLWFLPILFCAFLFFFLVRRFEKDNRLVSGLIAFICLCGAVIYSKISINLISYFARYILWFYLGMLYERKRISLDRFMNLYSMAIFFTLWLGTFFLQRLLPDNSFMNLVKKIISIVMTCSGISFAYALCVILSKTAAINNPFVQLINKYSFGIYLYSDTFNYVILSMFVSLFSISAFGSELASLLLFVSRILITLGISLLIAYLLRKLKLKNIS